MLKWGWADSIRSLKPPILPFCIEARTRLVYWVTELIMSQYASLRIICFQLSQQIEQGTFLGIRPCICRSAAFIQSAFVADADALVIPSCSMCSDLVNRTTDVYFTVTCDVEMISDACKAPCQMTSSKSFYGEILVTACCWTMNYQEFYLPIVLIKTSCSHSLFHAGI